MFCFQCACYSLCFWEYKWIFCCIICKCKCCLNCMSCSYIFKCIGSSLSYGCSVNFNIADFISIICRDRECCTFTFCNRYLAVCKTFCCDRTAFTCCCCDIIRLNCNILRADNKVINSRSFICIRSCD